MLRMAVFLRGGSAANCDCVLDSYICLFGYMKIDRN